MPLSRWPLWAASLGIVSIPWPAEAFPPYRTTDADTAGADVVELRLGVLRLQRRDSASERSLPLVRANFGVGPNYEVISELEYAIDEHRFAEGALGFKWASLEDGRGIGVETLVLLPVHSALDGAGIESQFLRSWQQRTWQMHGNIGAFYDPRAAEQIRRQVSRLARPEARGGQEPGRVFPLACAG